MNVTISVVGPDRIAAVSEAIARWQSDPQMHICYLGVDAASIASDLSELEPAGLDASLAAFQDDQVMAFLAAEWDEDPPRVWWYGPYVDPVCENADELADVLYERLRLSLPRGVVEEELATDDRHGTVAGFAARHGFERIEDASAVFILPSDAPVESETSLAIGELASDDRRTVAGLHDRLFPGTHSTGERITAGEHHEVLLVARIGDEPVGYIACEIQSDATGYIDYVGVAEDHRGEGIGKALVGAAVHRLRDLGCADIALTVRESNLSARRLYRSVGFTEERLLRPWRKGFGL